ncbi:hypothetical protein [Campylobacter cuniculorum]|uniref:Pyridoxamine 5'-phosphate oxidase family protein n=2 Tax=Campylobacter cuniculorum TaxID=374106 RepID=A0ABX6TX14_9BACT|nr:hypothetical protein [Campylobacter cuniculorum]ARJ56808.1 hypothetical protein, pyridoxine 5'-phosphate oxidase family [Campylobacter cuniculorum DSM 23162 = LMG 24588]QOR04274.1 hypothetical protein A0071_08985 [Campylobacter cuniculorum]
MDKKILEYIKSMQLLSLAVREDEEVYIANVFYAFDESNLALIFSSYEESKHIQLAFLNPKIALSIAKEDKIALLKGLQAKALFKEASKEQSRIYYKKFPFARLSHAKLYALELFWAKFTDNTLMLDSKLEFKR